MKVREGLVEAGVVLIVVGLVLLAAPSLLEYREFYPLVIACLGAAVLVVGVLMLVVPKSLLLPLKMLASGLLVLAVVLILLSLIAIPPIPFVTLRLGYKYSFTYSKQGSVTGRIVEVRVDNSLGETVVSAWDSDQYYVKVVLNVYAPSREHAERLANVKKPEIVVEKVGERTIIRVILDYKVVSPAFFTYDVYIKVPKSVSSELHLATSTGKVSVEGLRARDVSIHATTGQVVLKRVAADSVSVTATTGEIDAEVDARYAVLQVTTGRLSLRILGNISGEYALSATTGSIDVIAPDSPSVGVRLEAESHVGDVDFPSSWVVIKREGFISTKVVAETPNYAEAPVRLLIRASVTTGDLDVEQG